MLNDKKLTSEQSIKQNSAEKGTGSLEIHMLLTSMNPWSRFVETSSATTNPWKPSAQQCRNIVTKHNTFEGSAEFLKTLHLYRYRDIGFPAPRHKILSKEKIRIVINRSLSVLNVG